MSHTIELPDRVDLAMITPRQLEGDHLAWDAAK